jgi:hypothetical protein
MGPIARRSRFPKTLRGKTAVNSLENDAFFGPVPIEIVAHVAAQMAEPDRAIAALQKLLSIPYEGALAANVPLTPAAPARSNVRFAAERSALPKTLQGKAAVNPRAWRVATFSSTC